MSLWKNFNKKSIKDSPSSCVYKHKSQSKETSLYTRHRASLTLEATVVIPVMAGVLVTVLFFFRVIQVQTAVEEALMYAGRRVAVESSAADSEAVQLASAEAFLLYILKDEPVIQRYVRNGSLGVVLLGSEFQEKRIVLQANYYVKLPIAMFGIDGIPLWNRNIFRKWVGDLPGEEADGETWVYTTPGGTVYHSTDSCRVLKLDIQKDYLMTVKGLRGKNGQKYYACSHCAEESTDMDMVYYTAYGTLYHGKIDCRFIKRTINKQLLSEVENRRPCSYCYDMED